VLVVLVDCGVPEHLELVLNFSSGAYILVIRPPFPSQAKVCETHVGPDEAQIHFPVSSWRSLS
jgi:hypothetical protein